jgi:hypothetical protein
MEVAVGAKSTKPGSKANARRGAKSEGRATRVPVGVLHAIDMGAQSPIGAMFDALCGESGLISLDGTWDDDFDNERCEQCGEQMWAKSFADMQSNLLK